MEKRNLAFIFRILFILMLLIFALLDTFSYSTTNQFDYSRLENIQKHEMYQNINSYKQYQDNSLNNENQILQNNYIHIIILAIFIFLYLICVFITNKFKLNEICLAVGALLIFINIYSLSNIAPIYTYDESFDELTNQIANINYAIGLNFPSLLAVVISYVSFFINKRKISNKN